MKSEMHVVSFYVRNYHHVVEKSKYNSNVSNKHYIIKVLKRNLFSNLTLYDLNTKVLSLYFENLTVSSTQIFEQILIMAYTDKLCQALKGKFSYLTLMGV